MLRYYRKYRLISIVIGDWLFGTGRERMSAFLVLDPPRRFFGLIENGLIRLVPCCHVYSGKEFGVAIWVGRENGVMQGVAYTEKWHHAKV